MSSVTKGTAREMAVGKTLGDRGYRWCKVSRSGQVVTGDRTLRICADLVAFAPRRTTLPHLLVSVGGAGKRLGVAFAELIGDGLPAGYTPMVVMFKGGRRWYYSDADSRHATLDEAFDAMRDA